MDVSDSVLVERGRGGDRRALQALVERYQRRVLGVVVGMVRNPEDAREVVQETFVRAFRSLDSFKGDSSFYTWIYRIAVNLAIDVQRKNSKRTQVEFDETQPPADAPLAMGGRTQGADPYEAVRNRELGDKIFRAIDSLTPDHRAVILLREIEGLTYEEISQALGCSMGTVMSRLHYARKKLQDKLRDLL
ncbi:MAG: sigma-70 family RNA polymerase sigma factor [Candidatus Dadabacteria bacterium]|nr:MAG: sigma-70 family RNA polymerase sigma factor [Candidatus Dadabacteria bacterium]